MFGPQAKSQQRIEGHVDSDQEVEIRAGTRPWMWRDNSFNQASDADYSHFNAGFSPKSHQSAHVGFSPKSPCITSVSTRLFQPHITVPYISQHTLVSAPNHHALHQSAHAGFSPKSPCITSVSTCWFQPQIPVHYISQHMLVRWKACMD